MADQFEPYPVSSAARHHLFLAVKEALNNAIRHGGATEIGFRVRVEDHRLVISVSDNGNGFDPSGLFNGNGLLNLRTRLEQLHGQCQVDSSPGTGTTVSLQMKLPPS